MLCNPLIAAPRRLAAGLLLLLASGSAWSQQQAAAAPPAKPAAGNDIPTVIVRPERDDALSKGDRKLAEVIKGLPGADDPVAAKRSRSERIGEYYEAHRDPNSLPLGTQQMLQKTINGGSSNNNQP